MYELTGWVKYVAKAVYSAVTTALGGVIISIQDGGITTAEGLWIALITITVTGGVFGLTNGSKPSDLHPKP